MPTRKASLSQERVAFVEGEVASGEYGTASEVVRDGLRLLRRGKAMHEATLAVLRREVRIGVKQARSGRLSKRSIAEAT